MSGTSRPSDGPADAGRESTYREYVLDISIVEERPPGGEAQDAEATTYRVEAPGHVGATFERPELAELYVDVYFDTNGFAEEGTGDRGVPPEVIQAGRDTLAAYFLTRPYTDLHWIASFYGKPPERIERYVAGVKERAAEIREGIRERGADAVVDEHTG